MGHLRHGSIKDKVAIIGVGATKFGELWDKNQYDLLMDSSNEAFKDAGLKNPQEEIDAIWVGIQYGFTGFSGGTATDAMKIYGKPATHVENYCASGMDAFRNACFSVACGKEDIVLACGVEKLMDEGSAGLPGFKEMGHPVLPIPSAPAMFCFAASRSFKQYGWTKEDLARVAVKNHDNGFYHPKAHFRKKITIEDVMEAPMIADPLGRYDCCAMSDGSAALVITTPEIADTFTNHAKDYVTVKANALSVHTNTPWYKPSYSFVGFPSTQQAAQAAYTEAGITAKDVSFAEVHDCFTITEMVNYQDLGFIPPGTANEWLKNGGPMFDGEKPVNISGGLKCFGHPIGATGCRMLYEITRQLQGRAEGRQVKNPVYGLAHNLGGAFTVASVTVLGHKP